MSSSEASRRISVFIFSQSVSSKTITPHLKCVALQLCICPPGLKGLNASASELLNDYRTVCVKTGQTGAFILRLSWVFWGSYEGKCASHLSSAHADVTFCLFLSSAQCRLCCLPFPDNALHIQRRQPVGTWRCNTLPSCTGLLYPLLSLFCHFFVPPSLYKNIAQPSSTVAHRRGYNSPSVLPPARVLHVWGISVPPCSFVWFPPPHPHPAALSLFPPS